MHVCEPGLFTRVVSKALLISNISFMEQDEVEKYIVHYNIIISRDYLVKIIVKDLVSLYCSMYY